MSPTRLIGSTNNRCETVNFLLAKEKPSHRFHPVGEIFLLRVVASFSFFGGRMLVADAWCIGLAAGPWAV